MGSIKTLRLKRKYGKKMKQNRPIPMWLRMRTDNKQRYNFNRRPWRRVKLRF